MTFKTINYYWFIYYASATLRNYGYVLNTYRIEWMVYIYFTYINYMFNMIGGLILVSHAPKR